MIGIVIVAHGGLAQEYLAAIEHVVGSQFGVRAIAIEADHDRAECQRQANSSQAKPSHNPYCAPPARRRGNPWGAKWENPLEKTSFINSQK